MDSKYKIKNNANDLYNIYTEKEELISFKKSYFITEGINQIIQNENFLEIAELIFNQQKYLNLEIQIWEISKVSKNLYNMICKDSEGKIKNTINNIILDFYFDFIKVIIKDDILCLPVEFESYINS